MEVNSNNNKIIYPDNTAEIINYLVEKHGLENPEETIIERLATNKKSIRLELVFLLGDLQQNTIDKKNLVSELQARLDIAEDKAKNLAKDIEIRFSSDRLRRKTEEYDTYDANQNYDEYREPIE